MKYLIAYAALALITYCADDTGEKSAGVLTVRALLAPITIINWFRKQPQQLHRLLTIFWVCITGGWFITLLLDRIH